MSTLLHQVLASGDWLALLAVKATVLLLLALAATRLLHQRPARARHALWTLTFTALAALPLLQVGLPDVPMPGLAWTHELSRIARTVNTESAPQPAARFDFDSAAALADTESVQAETATPSARTDPLKAARLAIPSDVPVAPSGPTIDGRGVARGLIAALVALWMAGTGVVAALLALAVLQARRIADRALPVRHSGWLRDYEIVRDQLGIRRAVALRVTDAVDTPMAGGVLAPFVLLPRAALAWPASRRRVVMQHELAHLRGLDPLRTLIARIAAALYWFHPLVWVAGRDAVLAREAACDETVVDLGTRPSFYATVLLELAGPSGGPPIPALVLPMIQRSLLETRLMSILKADRPRGGRRVLFATVVTMSFAVLSVAAAAPQAKVEQEKRPPKIRVETSKPQAEAAPAVLEAESPTGSVPSPPRPSLPAQEEPAACRWNHDGSGQFSGSMSITGDSETRVREAVGSQGGDRIVRTVVDGVTLCLRGLGPVAFSDDMTAIESIGADGRVLLATIDDQVVAEMEITGTSLQDVRWTINGEDRVVDAAANEWRSSLMEVVGHQWHVSTLRGEVSSLRGQISSARGRMSSLRGELSSLRGEASTVRGRMASMRGRESSLRGEISSLRGRVSSMRGEISSHRGAVSGLQAQRYRATAEESRSIDQKVAEHEAAIEAIQQRLDEFDLQARIEAVERQIEALDVDAELADLAREAEALEAGERMDEIQARIEDSQIESEREIERLQRQIEEMNADERVAAVRVELDSAAERLAQALRDIR